MKLLPIPVSIIFTPTYLLPDYSGRRPAASIRLGVGVCVCGGGGVGCNLDPLTHLRFRHDVSHDVPF